LPISVYLVTKSAAADLVADLLRGSACGRAPQDDGKGRRGNRDVM
jgi:hypothetical protein